MRGCWRSYLYFVQSVAPRVRFCFCSSILSLIPSLSLRFSVDCPVLGLTLWPPAPCRRGRRRSLSLSPFPSHDHLGGAKALLPGLLGHRRRTTGNRGKVSLATHPVHRGSRRHRRRLLERANAGTPVTLLLLLLALRERRRGQRRGSRVVVVAAVVFVTAKGDRGERDGTR